MPTFGVYEVRGGVSERLAGKPLSLRQVMLLYNALETAPPTAICPRRASELGGESDKERQEKNKRRNNCRKQRGGEETRVSLVREDLEATFPTAQKPLNTTRNLICGPAQRSHLCLRALCRTGTSQNHHDK